MITLHYIPKKDAKELQGQSERVKKQMFIHTTDKRNREELIVQTS